MKKHQKNHFWNIALFTRFNLVMLLLNQYKADKKILMIDPVDTMSHLCIQGWMFWNSIYSAHNRAIEYIKQSEQHFIGRINRQGTMARLTTSQCEQKQCRQLVRSGEDFSVDKESAAAVGRKVRQMEVEIKRILPWSVLGDCRVNDYNDLVL